MLLWIQPSDTLSSLNLPVSLLFPAVIRILSVSELTLAFCSPHP